MLNIFFDINYIKTKKVFLTKSLRHSKLINLLLNFGNTFNKPIPQQFIFSGPHKRMNNLLKTFKGPKFSINKRKFNNSYIVNFDANSEKLLLELLKDPNSKTIVGPLFDVKYQKKLIEYTNKYSNVKKLVASNPAYKNAVYELNERVNPDNVYICPSGVISKKELIKNRIKTQRNDKCLIYFKKRDLNDLELVINFLKSKHVEYELFEYGKYNNKDLISFAKKNKFGIYISGSETQGFAVQELMACNLPLYIWDDLNLNSKNLSRYYGGGDFTGTSATWWSDDNGYIVHNFQEFKDNFDKFMEEFERYQPTILVEEHLTFESFRENLVNLFSKF